MLCPGCDTELAKGLQFCGECGRKSDLKNNSPMREADQKDKLCSGCNEPLVGARFLRAIGKEWHVGCFACSKCKAQLYDGKLLGKFFLKQREILCTGCCSLNAPRCYSCGGKCLDHFVEAMNKKWHEECLCCYTCREVIKEACAIRDKKPFCVPCADEARGGPLQDSVPEDVPTAHRFCRHCGNLVRVDKSFCGECGSAMSFDEQFTPPEAEMTLLDGDNEPSNKF